MRWAIFFLALAVLNEIIWRTQTTDFWVNFKVFGVVPITFVFAAFQFPLLQKYTVEEKVSLLRLAFAGVWRRAAAPALRDEIGRLQYAEPNGVGTEKRNGTSSRVPVIGASHISISRCLHEIFDPGPLRTMSGDRLVQHGDRPRPGPGSPCRRAPRPCA